MQKIRLSQAVIVEGKYDKLKLSGILDAFIVETNGFGIFKDKQRLAFIKKLAGERGIIVFTDSDHAGFMIRNYISSGIPKEQITNVYIPDIFGKERRKTHPSKEGKLGVEGVSVQVLRDALDKANITGQSVECADPVTNFDMYDMGLSGTPDAKSRRNTLLKELDLPEFLSTSALLSCINNMMTRDEFIALCKRL
ncbi:MAG: toprim domain-containing protein [Eubacterium sp.]